MRNILMILTSHRLDCFRLNMELLLHQGDVERFDRVVLMLNGVKGRHLAYVRNLMATHPEVPWDTVAGPRGKKQFVANLQNEVVKRYPDSLYFKIDEDVYPSKGWVEKLTRAHEAHRHDPGLALVTPVIPNNALGACHLLQRFPELGRDYVERFHEEISDAYNGPVWRRPDIAEWLIRQFLNLAEANLRLAAHPAQRLHEPFSQRFSINCLVYDYRHWQELGGIPDDEEPAWTGWVGEQGKFNVLSTDTLMQHYSFFVQQDWLDRSTVLEDLRNANLPSDLHHTGAKALTARALRLTPQIPRALIRKTRHLMGKE